VVVDAATAMEPGHRFDTVAVAGALRSATVSASGYGLQLCRVDMDPGASLAWTARHGDEGLYVVRGAVEVDGRVCPADGAVVVESGVAATLTAVQATQLVHLRSTGDAQAARGSLVHVVGPAGWAVSGREAGLETRWFTDSTCPTCSIALLHVRHDGADRRVRAHSHSQDEIIHMLSGSIALGSRVLGPGSSLCIPADVRYAFVGGARGYAYLNYRAAASWMTYEPRSAPVLEGGVALGGEIVADLR
jgi:quercetin dioxygenase-like cupin family protein